MADDERRQSGASASDDEEDAGGRSAATGGPDRAAPPLSVSVARTVVPGAVRRSYGAKFAVAFLVVILLVAGLGAATYVQTQEITRVDAERTLRSTADLQSESVGDWVASMTAETRGAAAWSVYRSSDRTRIRGHLTRTLQRAGPSVVGFHYVDPQTGEIVVSTDREYEGAQVDSVSPTWWDAVDETTATREWNVSVADAAYEVEGDTRLAFAAPVNGGVLVAVGDAETDYERHNGTRTVHRTAVLNAAGDPVFDRDDDAMALAGTAAFRAALNGTPGTREHGGEVVALVPVPGVDWAVVTAASKSALYGASHTVGRNVVFLVVASLLTLSAVAVVLGYGTVTSLRRLRRRAEAMEAGDLDVDLRTHREDEIGRLFAAFDNMRDALRTQIREAEAARERAEQSRRDLERQNERLDQFASTVSHDLRNPLNVAGGHLQLVDRKLDDLGAEVVEALSSHVGKIDDAHQRMEAIIEDVLALARQGQDIEETQPVDLATIAEDAWATVDSGPAAFEIAETRRLRADPDRLRQALENRFRNAVDHGLPAATDAAATTDGGDASPDGAASDDATDAPLTVEVGITDEGFYVADTGPGIPEDQVADVFEYGHTTEDDGTGFGLAIVETIVSAHGWEIAVDETYDDGAKFVVTGVEAP